MYNPKLDDSTFGREIVAPAALESYCEQQSRRYNYLTRQNEHHIITQDQ